MASISLGKWSRTDEVIKAFPEQAKALATVTTIVTGANTGIGKETAGALASLGGRVIFACRDKKKGDDAIEEMRKRYDSICSATSLVLDLSSLQGVKTFAQDFREQSKKESWPPLGCLVLNAGIFALGSSAADRSADGYEMSFAVNHLGHYLLTRLLLPELRSGRPSRVVVVASEAHSGALLCDDLTNKEAFMKEVAHHVPSGGLPSAALMKPYSQSKLCNVLFARELHEQEAESSGIAACSLHPGSAISTDIARGSAFGNFMMKHVMSFFTKDVNQGASTTVYCALCPHSELRGRYFSDCAVAEKQTSPKVLGDEGKKACTTLWSLSEELCRSFL